MDNIQLDKGEISIVKAVSVLVGILIFFWGVVTTLVLPINSMQVQLAQIQVALKTQGQNFTALQAQETLDANNIIILKQQVGIKP